MDELLQVKRGRHCRSSVKDCDWHEATGFVNWIGQEACPPDSRHSDRKLSSNLVKTVNDIIK